MASMEELSNKEKEAVKVLRMRMQKELSSEIFEDIPLLCRFLTARNWNVENAEIMLRKNLTWRKSHQVDTILQDFETKKFFHVFIEPSHVCFDKDGDIVEYNPTGKLEATEIYQCVKFNDYIRHWICYKEKLAARRKQVEQKMGRRSSGVTFILNLDKLTLRNILSKYYIEVCLRFLHILCDNYPEFLKAAYVLNAPKCYTVLYSILKPFLSKEMIQKIHIFGSDGWKEKLLEAVHADDLPAFLGGNKTDPDGNPLCTTFISHSGTIPETYYISDEERQFKDATRVKKLVISPKGKEEVIVDITEAGSKIRWEFLIKKKDIGFGLFLKMSEKEMNEVLPVWKYDTMDGTEEYSYKTQITGKYIIIFDNSHSWMTSKEIEYCITVIKPELLNGF